MTLANLDPAWAAVVVNALLLAFFFGRWTTTIKALTEAVRNLASKVDKSDDRVDGLTERVARMEGPGVVP